jgi:hypothetical protein
VLESSVLFVVRALHLAVSKGKADSWPYTPAKDISKASVEAFAAKFSDICSVTYTTGQKSVQISIVLHDLSPFCKFEAYDDRHYGSVWKNHNNNFASVVPPAILSFTELFQKPTKPLRTKCQLHVNTLRWDGDEWDMSGDFAGVPDAKRSKFRRFTREAIGRRSEEGATAVTEKLREDLWILSSKLSSLADLSAVKAPVDVDPESIIANLEDLRNELQGFMPRIDAEVVCESKDMDEQEATSEQRAALKCLVHAAEKNAALCDERAKNMKRVSSIYGCNFHPGTTCSVCDASPIIGWLYKCTTCDVCICEERRCVASHPLDHKLTLVRSSPPAAPESDILIAATKQKWRVNCILGHWPIPQKRGDKTPRKYIYHVSWEGKGVPATWEHEYDLGNIDMLVNYQRQFQKKRRIELARSCMCVYVCVCMCVCTVCVCVCMCVCVSIGQPRI